VRDFVAWFWWTGMRPGEIRQLTWAMFDRETWTFNLDPKADKTRKGRVIAIEGPLREIIDRRLKARRLDCPLVFHRVSKGRPGQPILDFRCQWNSALEAAKLPAGLLPYDLRRSALRNMVRGGTDFSVVIKISGHRTRSTFDRYNITSAEDIKAAIARTARYVATLPTERNVRTLEDSQKTHTQASRRKSR
jgi:integrase